jgi:hypothetical protein
LPCEEKFHEPIPPRRRVQGRLPEAEGGEVVFPEVFSDRAREESLEDVRRIMDGSKNETTRRFVMTIAERLHEEGLQTGVKKGRFLLIQKMLNKRFGGIPPKLEKRLEAARAETLDEFGESLFDFRDLEDAEAWWTKRGEPGRA